MGVLGGLNVCARAHALRPAGSRVLSLAVSHGARCLAREEGEKGRGEISKRGGLEGKEEAHRARRGPTRVVTRTFQLARSQRLPRAPGSSQPAMNAGAGCEPGWGMGDGAGGGW